MTESSNESRREWWPIAMAVSGALVASACAVFSGDIVGPWQLGVYAAAVLVIVATVGFRRRVSQEELRLKSLSDDLVTRESELAARQQELEQQREEAMSELTTFANRVDRREKELYERLVSFHEWTEFPEPVDLSDPEVSDAELAELSAKDRQMLELLDEESKIVFERIRNNEYSKDGKFDFIKARDDAYDLVQRVARIYQPDVEQPILETNVAKIVRSLSHACLHFLAVLDQLPINVKDRNLQTIYTYVRQAVKAYGAYKAAEPYLTFARHVVRVGRFVAGVNPVLLGAQWLGGSLAVKGAKSLSTRYLNRQALFLLHDMVRIIGFEVAEIYGGDFRHRDANWIYAAELTELISHLPPSRDCLIHALNEISTLQLRSEYDRMYVLRLLAEQKSAHPKRFRAEVCLTLAERQAISDRLNAFLTKLGGTDRGALSKWRDDVQQRLDVRLLALDPAEAPSLAAQRSSSVDSLLTYLLLVKQREFNELCELMLPLKSAAGMERNEIELRVKTLREDAPALWEQPLVDPESEAAHDYFIDLGRLTATVEPVDAAMDAMNLQAAEVIRLPKDDARKFLDQQYVEEALSRFATDDIPRRLSPALALAILSTLSYDERPCKIYDDVSVDVEEQGSNTGESTEPLTLLLTDQRLLIFELDEPPELIWFWDDEQAGELTGERQNSLIATSLLIRGGRFANSDASVRPAIRLTATRLLTSDSYFQPLEEFVGQMGKAAP